MRGIINFLLLLLERQQISIFQNQTGTFTDKIAVFWHVSPHFFPPQTLERFPHPHQHPRLTLPLWGYGPNDLQTYQSREEVLDALSPQNKCPSTTLQNLRVSHPSLCQGCSMEIHTLVHMKEWPLVPTYWTLTFPTFTTGIEWREWHSHPVIIPTVPILSFPLFLLPFFFLMTSAFLNSSTVPVDLARLTHTCYAKECFLSFICNTTYLCKQGLIECATKTIMSFTQATEH